jgi:hypothetical protein
VKDERTSGPNPNGAIGRQPNLSMWRWRWQTLLGKTNLGYWDWAATEELHLTLDDLVLARAREIFRRETASGVLWDASANPKGDVFLTAQRILSEADRARYIARARAELRKDTKSG